MADDDDDDSVVDVDAVVDDDDDVVVSHGTEGMGSTPDGGMRSSSSMPLPE
jgi:hypothetical protein